jgi:two-component system OmpR family sensor kinase
MSGRSGAPSLRREIVVWYSVVLLVALSVFATLSYLILRQTLARTGTASLQQTAFAAEQLIVPPNVPRLGTREDRVAPGAGDVEALRRRTRLASGDLIDIYVARSGDVEERALQSFVIISLILIPLTAGAAALGGRRVADRLLQPLDRLVHATREIGIGALSRRVEEPARPAELRELASAFNAMLARLDAAVDALRRFTADASHELRTPLAAIRGTAQVALGRERSAEELRTTLAEVVEETEWMLHLVESLLTLARGEELGTRIAREPVDLPALLTDVREIGEALATDKPVDIRLDAPRTLHISGAPGPLRQVFLNLITNAVKFTEQGAVTITAREISVPAQPERLQNEPAAEAAISIARWVEVSVEDTGEGIAAEHLPHVFDRFYRGDAARGRDGGTGLGLAIARAIVEQHGGTIEAESAPGQGSRFRVRLPANQVAPAGYRGSSRPAG